MVLHAEAVTAVPSEAVTAVPSEAVAAVHSEAVEATSVSAGPTYPILTPHSHPHFGEH